MASVEDAGDVDKVEGTTLREAATTRNAFTELMKPKPKPDKSRTPNQFRHPATDLMDLGNPRNHLLPYIQKPESAAPAGSVVSYNDDWVLIKDLYPKSSVHLLLLPRSPQHYVAHPFDALQDPQFLSSAKAEVEKAKDLIASELRRLYGSFSASERPRRDALESDDPPDTLPPGRDWRSEVIAGIHTHPSMNHMHVHIISRDRHSPCLKHRKHYNSFNTDFFVPLEAFPLSPEECQRRWGMEWHKMDMGCWRCGKNFGNRFQRLKDHLEEEFMDWRKE
ncbi:aprataxin-like protein [Rhizodiscina lignyota]|uniref:Aprataxin-like protein n=1 Tax=Rhizodiscina lignyota TaxID=1504668 RepID=A0A9P4MC75_9PEZI|nr:aprataxin-like protein [Rhizodiscina lignyota]